LANFAKVAQGGYVPLILAALVYEVVPVDAFMANIVEGLIPRVSGTAVFLTRTQRDAPPVMVWHIKHNRALHERLFVLTVTTERIPFATAIAPICARSVDEFAQNAAYLHEVSGGRFQFGIGIAHALAYVRMEVKPGKPLGDIRAFVEKFQSHTEYGPLPPVILAALRKRMIALPAEIADGLVFANASRAHMTESLGALPAAKRSDPDFFIGNRIRTCISDDIDKAKGVLRKTMAHYWAMPNYRNYWKEAGYLDEMNAAEAAIAAGRTDELPIYLTDRWLADCTLYGPAARIREGVEQWRDAGITTPVLVPLSPDGNQMNGLKAVFAAFER
jgi:alkanesulfonate monooxygenase SsuD/methylene tetrahydromethanopterin reductase-like flavin-dependent oxidoreductase (luciferase family)